MIYDYFTLRSEESMKRDNLNRSVFSREDLMRLKEPVIDKEIFRIRQEICEALESYNGKIDELKEEMTDYVESAKDIRRDIKSLKAEMNRGKGASAIIILNEENFASFF